MTTAWLVLGDKPGDNAQAQVLGEALRDRLGWEVETRRVAMLPEWVKGKPRVEASLHHIDRTRSDALQPPWPDLVVTVGRRPSMVALWLREQAGPRPDGRRLPIVRIGKPTGSPDLFDLVIVSAEVQIAPHPHVLKIGLPLMRIDPARIAAAAETWRARFDALPRPVVGFLLGGPTGPYRFGPSVMASLMERVAAVIDEGGTPWITTSRRTPPAFADELARLLPAGARLHRWSPNPPLAPALDLPALADTAFADSAVADPASAEPAPDDGDLEPGADADRSAAPQADSTPLAMPLGDNPYPALLAFADGLVVTGDSISMMVEAARLGRPFQILPLSMSRGGQLDLARRRLTGALFRRAHRPGWREAAQLATSAGLGTQTRDFEAFHTMLLERGLASELGGLFRASTGGAGDDLGGVVTRLSEAVRPGAGGRTD